MRVINPRVAGQPIVIHSVTVWFDEAGLCRGIIRRADGSLPDKPEPLTDDLIEAFRGVPKYDVVDDDTATEPAAAVLDEPTADAAPNAEKPSARPVRRRSREPEK